MLEHFAKLLDLPTNYPELIYKEAKAKYGGTYIFVNGSLCVMDTVDSDYLYVYTDKNQHVQLSASQIQSIENFLPASGIYFFGKEKISLRRLAKKQWRRSFNWDMYTCTPKSAEVPYRIQKAIQEGTCSEHDGITFHDSKVYYLEKYIGYRDKANIYHVLPLYEQELIDLFGKDRVQIDKTLKEVVPKKGVSLKVPKSITIDDLLEVETNQKGAMYKWDIPVGTFYYTTEITSAATTTAPISTGDEAVDQLIEFENYLEEL